MQQRYYDAQIGLFLSVDPVTAYDNPIEQFHRYRYANNNPYKFTDPSGRSATCDASSCQIVCQSIAECAGDYIYVGGVYVSRLLESAMISSGDDSDDGKPKEKPKSDPDVSNNDAPTDALDSITKLQDKAKGDRPTIDEDSDDDFGSRTRPKQTDIADIEKSKQRERHRNRRIDLDDLDDLDDVEDNPADTGPEDQVDPDLIDKYRR